MNVQQSVRLIHDFPNSFSLRREHELALGYERARYLHCAGSGRYGAALLATHSPPMPVWR
jgi:hypothetical protein